MILGTFSYPYRKICNCKLGFTSVETGFGIALSIKSLKYSDIIVWFFWFLKIFLFNFMSKGNTMLNFMKLQIKNFEYM